MTSATEVSRASKLGAHLDDAGCRFGLRAPRVHHVQLVLVDAYGDQDTHDMTLEEGVWSIHVPGVRHGQRYGFRVHGEWNPEQGMRANPSKLLVDPYARAITGGVDFSGPIHDHSPASNYLPDLRDSIGSVPLSVTVADTASPTPVGQRRPLNESVIYEAHVKGLTQLHPEVPEHLRGTYAGIAYPAVIRHLISLGVTAIQLLPVHHFVSEPFLIRRGLTNYWGYNTLGFFAPHAAYCSVGTVTEQVDEFKYMVSALHEAGIEVILDVVYNHTCEGGHEGPTLSFRGIDHRGYYRLNDDLANDYDVTGCGNSLDTSQSDVLNLVLDSMRYWVTEMGVDGFRFDLATTLIRDHNHHVNQNHLFKQLVANDPTFDDIKLITEPWDVGPYGYQVGRWGPGWSEWNDKYRGFVRDYWRGVGGVQELATRMSGSADLFEHAGRTPSASINFVTAHDGFTLRDLTSYNTKHNEANLESNRDGSNDNRSMNFGVEGETDNAEINSARRRQMRNLMATLLLSRGVPMLTAGDEIGRTQQGNNNAYCQDSRLSWLDWGEAENWTDLTHLVSRLIELRAMHPVLTSDDYEYRRIVRDEHGESLGRYNLAWLNGYSGEMDNRDWNNPNKQLLGMYLSDVNEAILTWIHSGNQEIQITLPSRPWGWSYRTLLHTADPHEISHEVYSPGEFMTLPPRCIVVMEVSVPSAGPIMPPSSAEWL